MTTRADLSTRNDQPSAQRGNLRHRIRRFVVDLILEEQVAPGQRLNETALAEQLGVSQTPVREALLRLEGEGIVRSRRGYGFELRMFNFEEIGGLYSVIAALEVLTLGETPPPGPEKRERLRALNRKLATATRLREMIRLDADWHEALLVDSRNHFALARLDALKVMALRHELAYWDDTKAFVRSVEHHEAILTALESGNRRRAESILRRNWLQAVEGLAPRSAGAPQSARMAMIGSTPAARRAGK